MQALTVTIQRVLIIADDLSGAADCGMAFAATGLSTVVALEAGAEGIDADVLSVDADTRALEAQLAAEKTERLLREYSKGKDHIVFKKLDSTLRGNMSAELASVLRVRRKMFPRAVAVLAPAFPANGRTTVRGRQLLHGRPLEETEVWQREARPASSYLPGILAEGGMHSALLSLDAVRSGHADLPKAMRKLTGEADVLVCDAETDHDLRAIAGASAALGPGTVWAGSAGLAYHLAETAGLGGVPFPAPRVSLASGPTLFIIGSPASMSQEQARWLSSSGETTLVTFQPEALVGRTAARETYKRQLADALGAGADIVVSLGRGKVEDKDARLLPCALAEMLAPLSETVGALVATGGETARSVLQAWKITVLRPVQELAPGVPFCIAENWYRRLPVVTKAGDFGGPDTLLRCQRFLRSLDRTSFPSKGL